MTASVKPKTEQDAWLDLIPLGDPDAVIDRWITREALLSELADNGIDVPERTLRYWETRSVLPRPLVRWKDGRPYTWYPPFAPMAVRWLLQLKDSGHAFDAIGPMLRGMIGELLKGPHPESNPRARWTTTTGELAEQIRTLSAIYAEMTGHSIIDVEIRLTDDEQRTIAMKGPHLVF